MDTTYFQILNSLASLRNSFNPELEIGIDLSDVESFSLSLIYNDKSTTQVGITNLGPFDKVAVSRACHRLLALRLISRRAHPSDRRMHVLALTVEGRRISEKLAAALCRWEHKFWRNFDSSAIDDYLKLTARLAEQAEIVRVESTQTARRNGPEIAPLRNDSVRISALEQLHRGETLRAIIR